MPPRNHDTGPSGVTVDQLIDRLFPVIDAFLDRLSGDEFTTIDLIELMQSDPATADAYTASVHAWGEQERPSKMVIHGQVIPGVLRRSTKVEWVGFAHDEVDEFAVPAWWRLKSS